MVAPAAAALLLAALATLPCQGTDAEASRILSENHTNETNPTINKLYQMLHTAVDIANRTDNLTNFNYSHNLSFDFYDINISNITAANLTEVDENDVKINKLDENDVKVTNLDDDKVKVKNLDDSGVKVNKVDENEIRNRKRRVVVVKNDGSETTPVPSYMMMERRRRPGETGSSAPLLNYIFDTYTNTHQHRNEKVGPINGIYAAAAPEIEALVGSTAHLDCKVDALHDKLVSWVRRKNDEDPMELLYTGTQQYTADDRYSSRFIPPDIWRLEVKEVRPSDAAHYDCQMPTHPPRTARLTLRVPEVSVRIVDGAGASVSEQVCELGSTVALRCEVRGLKMEGGPSLLWYRKTDLLNDDTTRGGISVRTEFGANGANSVLRVARVRGDDAGRYTCTVARAPPPGPPPAHVILHVIKGESLAELHQGGGTSPATSVMLLALSVLLHLTFIILTN